MQRLELVDRGLELLLRRVVDVLADDVAEVLGTLQSRSCPRSGPWDAADLLLAGGLDVEHAGEQPAYGRVGRAGTEPADLRRLLGLSFDGSIRPTQSVPTSSNVGDFM